MCELCNLVNGDIKTRKYYSNSDTLIVDCLTCKIPMLVFRRHGQAGEGERRKAIAVVNELFENTKIRFEGRKILNHEHWHLIDARLRGE